MARRNQAKAEHPRQQIINTARRDFRVHRVPLSMVDQITWKAGVMKDAVYWLFQDKQELLNAMLATATMQLLHNLEQRVQGVQGVTIMQ